MDSPQTLWPDRSLDSISSIDLKRRSAKYQVQRDVSKVKSSSLVWNENLRPLNEYARSNHVSYAIYLRLLVGIHGHHRAFFRFFGRQGKKGWRWMKVSNSTSYVRYKWLRTPEEIVWCCVPGSCCKCEGWESISDDMTDCLEYFVWLWHSLPHRWILHHRNSSAWGRAWLFPILTNQTCLLKVLKDLWCMIPCPKVNN